MRVTRKSNRARARLGLSPLPITNTNKRNSARAIAKAADVATETLLDEIKDAIDRLHEIPEGRRKDAARELIDYITLHQNLPCYG